MDDKSFDSLCQEFIRYNRTTKNLPIKKKVALERYNMAIMSNPSEKFDELQKDIPKIIVADNSDVKIVTKTKSTNSNISFYINEIRVGSMSKTRYEMLSTRLGLENDKYFIVPFVKYELLGSTSRHHALSLDFYQKMYNDGYRVEGFASFFSFQLGMVKNNDGNFTTDTSFCSLFPLYETCFGSRGSFFDNTFDNEKVVLNPPRITEMTPCIAEHCKNCIENHGTKFILILYYQECVDIVYNILKERVISVEKVDRKFEDTLTGNMSNRVMTTFLLKLE